MGAWQDGDEQWGGIVYIKQEWYGKTSDILARRDMSQWAHTFMVVSSKELETI
jgi:hypothetical protein